MTLLANLRVAARALLRARWFSLAIVASLAISVGGVTTVFALVDAVLLRALPYRDPQQLVWLSSIRPQRSDAPFSLPELMDYSARARTLKIAGYTTWSASMSTASVARRLQGLRASANTFEVLGMVPTVGRLLQAADDATDAPRVVVLGYAFWQSQFGGETRAVGQDVRLNGETHRIVGVLPRYFPLPTRDIDVVVPLVPDADPRRHLRNSTNFLRLIGRVGNSASVASAERELAGIAADLRSVFPAEYASKLGVGVRPMHEYLVGSSRLVLTVMFGGAALLLAIALANVLNLLLIRGIAKQGELALRQALGGTRRHLLLVLASEAALLVAAGAAAGAALAWAAVGLIASSHINLPRLDEARVDGRILGFVIALLVLATLLFSAIPLWSAGRTALQRALAAAGRSQSSARGHAALRAAFVVLQVAFAVILSTVASTMVRSLARLQRVELGYRPDSVVVARLALPPERFRTPVQLARFAEHFERELATGPGVVSAGGISVAPLSGLLYSVPFSVVGRDPVDPRERPSANFRAVSAGYLKTIGATLVSGRPFEESDNETGARVAVVTRALAERYLGGRDASGQQLLINDNNTGPRPVTIVGVIENMRHIELEGPPSQDIFIPLTQVHPDGVGAVVASQFWAVRVAAPASTYQAPFMQAIGAVDEDIAAARIRPMREYVDDALASRRFSVSALAAFAIVALVLAGVGVYSVIAYSVQQRRREIGLRIALGASRLEVTRFVMQPALASALLGVGLGVVGALVTKGVIAGLLFGVSAAEPTVLSAVSILLLATSAVAAAIPAQRAARIDPLVALAGD